MWLKNVLILLPIFFGTVLSYIYPNKNCCRWKPIHGPIGMPYPPKYATEYYQPQKRVPMFAPLRPKPIYGPPQIQKPVPVYGVPQQNFQNYVSHQEYNTISNYQNVPYQQHNLVVPQMQSVFAHHKVISASHDEAKLPKELLNQFYQNPHVKEALAKHSWIGPGEKPVLFRETDTISRQRIFEVLSHAGLIKRR